MSGPPPVAPPGPVDGRPPPTGWGAPVFSGGLSSSRRSGCGVRSNPPPPPPGVIPLPPERNDTDGNGVDDAGTEVSVDLPASSQAPAETAGSRNPGAVAWATASEIKP